MFWEIRFVDIILVVVGINICFFVVKISDCLQDIKRIVDK
jgi:hypothetical protein